MDEELPILMVTSMAGILRKISGDKLSNIILAEFEKILASQNYYDNLLPSGEF